MFLDIGFMVSICFIVSICSTVCSAVGGRSALTIDFFLITGGGLTTSLCKLTMLAT